MTEMTVIEDYVHTDGTDFSQWWPPTGTPGSLEDFFRRIQGNYPCLVHGGINRFKGLVDWDQVNQILNTNRLGYPQLRFTKDGENIPEFRYTNSRHSIARGTVSRELIPSEVHSLLRQGASMTIDGVDKIFPPIGRIAQSMERALGEEVNANMYCAFHGSRGFPVHWDAHDVYIIQIAGSKAWKVYEAGRKHPLDKDVIHSSEAPADIHWKGLLGEGDVLYLPRGVWHEAATENDFSLHVTFGCSHATGIDFLTWIVDKLRTEEDLRKDVITNLQDKSGGDYAKLVQEKLLQNLSEEHVKEFLEYRSTRSTARNKFQLPDVAYEDVRFADTDTFEFCTSTIQLDVSSSPEKVILITGGKTFKFSNTMEGLVQYFTENRLRQFTFSEILESVAKTEITSYSVSTVLSHLMREGVVRKSHSA